jgi:predicted dehydrogenase
MRQAVNKGLIGEVIAVHVSCHWNHEWIKTSHFNNVHHIILYDFAIHWFDIISCLMGDRPAKRVSASLQYAPAQEAKPPMLGQAIVEFEEGQASLVFDGVNHYNPTEINFVVGSKGSLKSEGPICGAKSVTIATKKGTAIADVSQGSWFPTGFHGSMGELLSAIEQKREPINNPLNNLRSLAMCFAAVASAESGQPVEVGKAKTVPAKRCSIPSAKPKPGKAA